MVSRPLDGPGAVLARAPSLDHVLARKLETFEHAGLRRALPHVRRRDGIRILLDGRSAIDFSSNDYLGLAGDPRVAQAAACAAEACGVGARAARLISGNHPLHELLEESLAAAKRTEAALLFGSGYLANVGVVPALVGRGDAIYADALNHASLIDGCRLARGEVRVFPHRDVDTLCRQLEADTGRFHHRLIVVESVFSMDGDLFPLDDLVRVARRHEAWTYVDDAHGTAVLGAAGRGAAEHFGVEGAIDVLMGTLGKALGTSGAFVAGSRTLVEYLRNRARTFVFTTGSPPPLAAAALAALRIAAAEPWRRAQVRANARRLREALARQGRPVIGDPDAPIVPVLLGDASAAVRLAVALARRGFFVGAIRPPTVPAGTARLRVSLSALHTEGQLAALAEALDAVLPAVR